MDSVSIYFLFTIIIIITIITSTIYYIMLIAGLPANCSHCRKIQTTQIRDILHLAHNEVLGKKYKKRIS